MSATISLKQTTARNTGAAMNFIQLCLLLAGLLSALGLVGVALLETPAGDLAALSEQPSAASPSLAVAAPMPLAPPAAQPVAVNAAAANTASALSPRMQGALDYVKRRYKVAPEALVPVFEVAQLIGKEMRIDPLLIVAIIGIESGFNPFAESSMGARGLMQIIPRFHRDKVPPGAGDGSLLDPLVNIRVGVQVLEEAIRRSGSLVSGLQQYAGSSEPQGLYANKVLAEKERLEQAARRVRPANAEA